MDADAVYRELSRAIRGLVESNARTQKMSAELQAQLDQLLQLLAARGDLNDGHRSMIDKLRARAQLATRPSIELSGVDDKYAVAGADIDCAARMHLCHGRCCALNITLSRQDLAEGELAWDIDRPYRLLQNSDGYCVYQARDTGACGNYRHRPATCRSYSCVGDARVWLDFDNMVPAPMAPGLVTIRRRPAP